MPIKYLNFDFYSVTVDDRDDRNFQDLLNFLGTKPDDASRAMQRSDDAIRLQSLRGQAGLMHGECLRIRLNETPVKATLAGRTQDVELDVDEGIGEETAFLFHSQTNVICMQRNRSGVAASALAKYSKVLCNARRVRMSPLLRANALARIGDLRRITKFQVNFAGVQNGAQLRGQGHSAGTIFSMLNAFEAPNASITMSIGREQGSLRNVFNAIGDLVQGADETNQTIKKLLVIGSEEGEEEKMVIDLFEDRLTETVQVEVEDGQRLNQAQRTTAIREAWGRQNDYIIATYQPAE